MKIRITFLAALLAVSTAFTTSPTWAAKPDKSAKPAAEASFVVGKPAPAFNAKNQHDKDVKLSDYAGKWLVLYFYPRDDTPG